ncbi:hypothetical protein HDU97_001306 [Phlyctochytrium planicorne]|nr:hypothetical protein HDU97_001306 [Phlyctochytrium planicorne]
MVLFLFFTDGKIVPQDKQAMAKEGYPDAFFENIMFGSNSTLCVGFASKRVVLSKGLLFVFGADFRASGTLPAYDEHEVKGEAGALGATLKREKEKYGAAA